MLFRYAPEGVEPCEWDFRPNKMMSPEAELIERLTGLTFTQWEQAVLNGSMLATRAYLFVLLKRDQPGLKFEQVAFSMSEVEWDYDAEDKARIREQLTAAAADPGLDEDQARLWAEVFPGEPEPTGAPEPEAPKATPLKRVASAGSSS